MYTLHIPQYYQFFRYKVLQIKIDICDGVKFHKKLKLVTCPKS
jgi:hypothetical protein